MSKNPTPHILKCILKVSPLKTDFTEKKRNITERDEKSIKFSVSDPMELKNFDSITADKIGKVQQCMHYVGESLFIAEGYCEPDQVEQMKATLWAAIAKTASSTYSEYMERLDRTQQVILKVPGNLEI